MPFLRKPNTKNTNPSPSSPNPVEIPDLKEKAELEKILKEKSETLRRLKLVKTYKTKNDIQNLDSSIKKWKNVSQIVLNDLYSEYVSNFKSSSYQNGNYLSMKEFIENLKIDHKLVGYDPENECFNL